MAWRCPDCGRTHEPSRKKCACGYAYYEVLGVKHDAPPDAVEQTYRYLLKVWENSAAAQDPLARSRALARLKKINDAYSVFLQATGSTKKSMRDTTTVKFAIMGGIGLVVFVVLAFYLFSPSQKGSLPAAPSRTPAQTALQEQTSPSLSVPHPREEHTGQAPAALEHDRPDMQAEKTPDWAIESVRKSRALTRVAAVDTIVNKWMHENVGKLSSLGWSAKKTDETIFLVSYTATDGVTPTGFYFDINAETGEIRNVADHPDLQQKYGIRVNRDAGPQKP